MGIFDRMGKLISSNVNALLDKAEDPRKTVDLLIEEMREQIRKARQDVVGAVATEKQLRLKIQDLDSQIDRWQRRAELAVTAADEPLAREALAQKLRLVSERDKAEALRAEQRGIALRMKDELDRGEQKIKELDARKATIVARYEQARGGGGAEGLGSRGTGPNPFDEMRRMEDKMDRQEIEAEALREAQDVLAAQQGHSGMSTEMEEKFKKLEAAGGPATTTQNQGGSPDEVDKELHALRKKLRVGG